MKKRLMASIILAAAAAICLTACGAKKETAESTASGTEEAPVSGEAQDPYMDVSGRRVAIAFPSAADERWSRDGEYLEQRFQEKGCTTHLVYSDGLEEQQTADVTQLIDEGCDLLIVSAIGDTSLAAPLAKAKAAGIPVIAYDKLIRGTDAVNFYVAYDAYRIGEMQGEYCIRALGLKVEDTSKEYNVEFIAGNPADTTTGYLFSGAYDTLKPYLDAGVLDVPSEQMTFGQVTEGEWDANAAETRMKTILNTYYDKKTELAIALCSDDEAAKGVSKVLDTSYSGKNHVIVTGCGAEADNLELIRKGKQSMTVYMAPEQEAAVTADLGLTLLAGESADANLISDGGWKFECRYDTSSYNNGKGIVPSFLIVPEVITADNIRKIT